MEYTDGCLFASASSSDVFWATIILQNIKSNSSVQFLGVLERGLDFDQQLKFCNN